MAMAVLCIASQFVYCISVYVLYFLYLMYFVYHCVSFYMMPRTRDAIHKLRCNTQTEAIVGVVVGVMQYNR
jgi:hypothetical protein